MIKNLSLKENIVEKSDYKFAFVKGPAWPKGDEDMKEIFEEFISKSKLNIAEITLPESFDNALHNRARIATLDIQRKYTNFKIQKGEAITAIGTTAIIEAAYSEGVIGIAT